MANKKDKKKDEKLQGQELEVPFVDEVAELPQAPIESNSLRIFRAKCDAALAQIQSTDDFRKSDEMVEAVMKASEWLFKTPLDQMTPDTLLRAGGKLVGAYAYLGQKSARARAERDVYEQKADEMEKEYVHTKLKEDSKYKVTNAKSEASMMFSDLREFVIQKDATKNQYEHICEATQTMIMFIQSSIRIKENERYASKRSHDNG